MRILLTGSSGQLGGEIARQLSAQHEIVGMDRIPGEWTTHVASVTDRAMCENIMQGMDAVLHIASLHAPHVGTLSDQDFIDVNVGGTSNLLEAAAREQVRRFVYTSTTSIYGHALVPADRAVWVTEHLTPQPRDIYDVTKQRAEVLCKFFAEQRDLPTIVLRTARFFPEQPQLIARYRLYRGVDVRDVAAAHVLAVTNTAIHHDLFNISARSPFLEEELPELWRDAPAVLRHRVPGIEQSFARRGWALPERIDRVYVIAKAEECLGYRPRHNFADYMSELGDGRNNTSSLEA
jgi:nucleoside-diphosphate-sugar epimerase